MQMPKLDGSTLFKKIRNTHNEVHPKLIILTGGININFEDKASELGKLIDGFLSKPFTSDSIKETIFSLLKINP